MDEYVPDGATAYREYRVVTAGGRDGSIAFTLGDWSADSAPARYAEHRRADAYGLVSVLHGFKAPEYPMVWTLEGSNVAIAALGKPIAVDEELELVLARTIDIFLREVDSLEPALKQRWNFRAAGRKNGS